MRIRRHPYMTYSSQNVTLLSNMQSVIILTLYVPVAWSAHLGDEPAFLCHNVKSMEALDTLNCVSETYKNFYWRWMRYRNCPFIVSTFADCFPPLVRKHGCKSIFYAPGIKVVYFNILQLVEYIEPYLLLQSLKPWDCVGDRVDGHLDAKCASAHGAWTLFLLVGLVSTMPSCRTAFFYI